jgi:hypothetical protein
VACAYLVVGAKTRRFLACSVARLKDETEFRNLWFQKNKLVFLFVLVMMNARYRGNLMQPKLTRQLANAGLNACGQSGVRLRINSIYAV